MLKYPRSGGALQPVGSPEPHRPIPSQIRHPFCLPALKFIYGMAVNTTIVTTPPPQSGFCLVAGVFFITANLGSLPIEGGGTEPEVVNAIYCPSPLHRRLGIFFGRSLRKEPPSTCSSALSRDLACVFFTLCARAHVWQGWALAQGEVASQSRTVIERSHKKMLR